MAFLKTLVRVMKKTWESFLISCTYFSLDAAQTEIQIWMESSILLLAAASRRQIYGIIWDYVGGIMCYMNVVIKSSLCDPISFQTT